MIVDYSPNFRPEKIGFSAASCLVLMSSWRRNGKRVDICPNFRLEKKVDFCLVSCTARAPSSPYSGERASLTTGSVTSFFTVTIMLLQFSHRHWELRIDVASEFGLMGGSVAECDRLVWFLGDDRSGTAGYCHSRCAVSRGYRRNVLKGTATVAMQYREDIAGRLRPISQARTRRLCSRGFGARPLASSSRTKLKKNRASRTPRASSRDWREHKYTRNIKN